MLQITTAVDALLVSEEPAVRYLAQMRVLGEDPSSPTMTALREEVRHSPRAVTLLARQHKESGQAFDPYQKWHGAHWVLVILADLGYPPGDESLIPLRERVLAWLLSDYHFRQITTMQGRVRRCASQEGNAIYALLSLGLADERVDELARRLVAWQWPDGGWNCDRNPDACHSSFMESLIPLRALALHARVTGNAASAAAAERAADVFLSRRLYRRRSNGAVIDADFVKLHYPCYWHYDILFGLKVMAEAGFIGDERCRDALALLESKRLPDGGFPAEARYYSVSTYGPNTSSVDWGGVSKGRMNPWVTVDALYVLQARENLR